MFRPRPVSRPMHKSFPLLRRQLVKARSLFNRQAPNLPRRQIPTLRDHLTRILPSLNRIQTAPQTIAITRTATVSAFTRRNMRRPRPPAQPRNVEMEPIASASTAGVRAPIMAGSNSGYRELLWASETLECLDARVQSTRERWDSFIVFGMIWAIGTAVAHAFKSPDSWVLIAIAAGAVLLIIMLKAAAKKRRIEFLMNKYGNETIVAHIMHHRFWHGQTAEQLMDSLGNPYTKDDKLLKTRKLEVWKYNRTGVNRCALRITLDNDVVTGWESAKRAFL
jgi:hypothetical protein